MHWIGGIADLHVRDNFLNRELQKLEWRGVRAWEHELKEPRKVTRKLEKALGGKSAADD